MLKIDIWMKKKSLKKIRYHIPIFVSPQKYCIICSAGDLGSIPGLGRSPGGGHGNPLQYSCLENLHGQRSLAGYTVHRVTESDTSERLSTALSPCLSLQHCMVARNVFFALSNSQPGCSKDEWLASYLLRQINHPVFELPELEAMLWELYPS